MSAVRTVSFLAEMQFWKENARKSDIFVLLFLGIFYILTVYLLSLLSVSYLVAVYLSFYSSAPFKDSLSLFLLL